MGFESELTSAFSHEWLVGEERATDLVRVQSQLGVLRRWVISQYIQCIHKRADLSIQQNPPWLPKALARYRTHGLCTGLAMAQSNRLSSVFVAFLTLKQLTALDPTSCQTWGPHPPSLWPNHQRGPTPLHIHSSFRARSGATSSGDQLDPPRTSSPRAWTVWPPRPQSLKWVQRGLLRVAARGPGSETHHQATEGKTSGAPGLEEQTLRPRREHPAAAAATATAAAAAAAAAAVRRAGLTVRTLATPGEKPAATPASGSRHVQRPVAHHVSRAHRPPTNGL